MYLGGLIASMIGSLYLGLCLYISGMTADMKTRLDFSVYGSDQKLDKNSLWSIYVQEIDFHNEIIEYGFYLLWSNLAK